MEKLVLNEFKKFALRGNVMDLAIAVILGGAFGKIVSSFVADIMMPPIGLLLGKVDFSNLYLSLSGQHFATLEEAKKSGDRLLDRRFCDFHRRSFSG
jgi:large conductance mechanosensitive channel